MSESTLQPSSRDTGIDEGSPTNNKGTNTTLSCGYNNSAENDDILIEFDLSTIEKGSTIEEAILSLYCDSVLTTSLPDMSVWRILESGWTEGGATWNTYDGSNSWGTVGAEQTGVDIASSFLYGPTDTNASASSWTDLTLNASEFQALVDSFNYGMKVGSNQRDNTAGRSHTYRTSEHATTSTRPKLYVRWIEPSGRLYEYTFNKYDPAALIRDSQGRVVAPEQIKTNKWLFVEGLDLPSGKVYANNIINPAINYIQGKQWDQDGEMLTLQFDRNQFADAVLSRLVKGLT